MTTWTYLTEVLCFIVVLDSSQQHETLKNSIKVLPEEAPVPLTEEERRKKAEDELYEKNIR
ncbi:hypothetical protein DPMN_142859 [Dreissena polymorpha]|uniref:Uncharacterized protein n=1 Tax=Dreissena polymorpha TaxID=45954 RepID=A0A9D4GFA2_DREPO|nr:hypothetical protein DPMN_142859 [Dreissena polymorpha]